jgi:ATP-dependent helicase/nuclease subunit B
MSVHLYMAPASAGKTAYLVERACAQSATAHLVRVVVPTQLQVRAWQRRLAEAGGALGVRVGTFDVLYREILQAAGEVYARLTHPVQYRLLRLLIQEARLEHYEPLRALPGFAEEVLRLVRELKAGGVFPEALIEAAHSMGGEPRLLELAELYLAYQHHLQARDWADAAGIGWLAEEALDHHPDAGRGWPCVMVDGFDDLTTVQLAVLRQLSTRVGALVVTLTGTTAGGARPTVHRRFHRTCERLQDALGVTAEALPAHASQDRRAPAIAHLEAALYAGDTPQCPANGALVLVAAPDREGEVRAALRWLKGRLIADGARPGEVALLARKMEAYRPYVRQVAAEYGLPVHMVGGLPLHGNPAVAALLDLLRLALPGGDAFAWRPTVEAWRCPIFDWETCTAPDADVPIGITAGDAEALDWVARWGSVLGGLAQWREAFDLLVGIQPEEALDEDLPPMPSVLPTGARAQLLRTKFEHFAHRVTPPPGAQTSPAFVGWIEGLIGDPEADGEGPVTDLGVARRILDGPAALRDRDLAALNALKDVLRGLVWAEEALGCAPMNFDRFFEDLLGAVSAATYHLPLPADEEAILAADVTQVRGVPFRALAVLGLAEGEFPTTLGEDPFLRDADRGRLRDEFGLAMELSTEGAEAGYFYEAVTRPRDALLLTRPRIADNGAPWQASPFWEEVRRRVTVEPRVLTSSHYPTPEEAASWPELLLGVGARADDARLWTWAVEQDGVRCALLEGATGVLRQRVRAPGTLPGPHDGELSRWGAMLARRFGPHHTWSASRLESYRACPFLFYVSSVLGVSPRLIPTEGLDARQLGDIYHCILRQLYEAVDDATDLDQLLAALPAVAGPILEDAPRREQFRATAWWAQTREEILVHVRDSVVALDALRGEYVPHAYELAFGIPRHPGEALVVSGEDGRDSFRLHGFIDRVDTVPDGRARIIDYKTGGPWAYSGRAFEEGQKLQLPLYALAAQQALGLGEIGDGFYWHVRHASWHLENAGRRSWFTLAKGGAAEAMERALSFAWEAVRGIRGGGFVPQPPDDGCPAYCPAVAFCWQYTPSPW